MDVDILEWKMIDRETVLRLSKIGKTKGHGGFIRADKPRAGCPAAGVAP